MTQGLSLIEALLALLILSCGLLFACSGVLKGLQQSQHAMLQVQLQLAFTDVWHSQAVGLQDSSSVSPATAEAISRLQQANPSSQFQQCQQGRVLSWFSAQPLTQFRRGPVCQSNHNQGVDLRDAARF